MFESFYTADRRIGWVALDIIRTETNERLSTVANSNERYPYKGKKHSNICLVSSCEEPASSLENGVNSAQQRVHDLAVLIF